MRRRSRDRLETACAALLVALAILLAFWAALVLWPKHYDKPRPDRFATSIHDQPVLNYPQYLKITKGQPVAKVIDGQVVIFQRSDFSSGDIQRLGLMLRAY